MAQKVDSFCGHIYVNSCHSKTAFLTTAGACRMPLNTPILRPETIVFTILNKIATDADLSDIDINFLGHNH